MRNDCAYKVPLLLGLGVGYATFASVIWPCIPVPILGRYRALIWQCIPVRGAISGSTLRPLGQPMRPRAPQRSASRDCCWLHPICWLQIFVPASQLGTAYGVATALQAFIY